MTSNLIFLQDDLLEIITQSLTHSIHSAGEVLFLPVFNNFWTSDIYRIADIVRLQQSIPA